jgi:hypothetical protein
MGVWAMIARDVEMKHREKAKLYSIIFSKWKTPCQKKGALKRVIIIIYMSHT